MERLSLAGKIQSSSDSNKLIMNGNLLIIHGQVLHMIQMCCFLKLFLPVLWLSL